MKLGELLIYVPNETSTKLQQKILLSTGATGGTGREDRTTTTKIPKLENGLGGRLLYLLKDLESIQTLL